MSTYLSVRRLIWKKRELKKRRKIKNIEVENSESGLKRLGTLANRMYQLSESRQQLFFYKCNSSMFDLDKVES